MNGNRASRVHVVDGDSAVRDSLSTLLDLNGFEVVGHSTAGAFLEHMRKCGTAPDGTAVHQGPGATATDCGSPGCAGTRHWVVCEADLPDGSGIELFSRVRAVSSAAPFILLVSRNNPSVIRSARDAGIDQVFQKPLVYRNLLSYISRQTH